VSLYLSSTFVYKYTTATFAKRYIDDILDNQVSLYVGAVGYQFIVMDVNARPQKGLGGPGLPRGESIERMDWQARSPELNQIEHMWNMLHVRIIARQLQPRIIQELEVMLVQEWATIPVRMIRNLIGSMRRRC
jgi:hypothetical protein